MNYKRVITTDDEVIAKKSGKGTIHIIDDDLQVLQALRDLIEYEGYLCHTYDSVTNFLEHSQSERYPGPRCILSDMAMPSHNGLDLQAMMPSPTDMVMIFMSGISTLDQTSQAFRNGAIHFLSKPIQDHVLFEAISEALDKSRQLQIELQWKNEQIKRIARLSPREREVAQMLAQGLAIKEMSNSLRISDRAVKLYKKNLMEKLNTNSLIDILKLQLAGLFDTV